MKIVNPGYVMYIVFYPCNDCESVNEEQYCTAEEHRHAIVAMYETIDSGGYCVVTRWNESETIRTKMQLWDFKI